MDHVMHRNWWNRDYFTFRSLQYARFRITVGSSCLVLISQNYTLYKCCAKFLYLVYQTRSFAQANIACTDTIVYTICAIVALPHALWRLVWYLCKDRRVWHVSISWHVFTVQISQRYLCSHLVHYLPFIACLKSDILYLANDLYKAEPKLAASPLQSSLKTLSIFFRTSTLQAFPVRKELCKVKQWLRVYLTVRHLILH